MAPADVRNKKKTLSNHFNRYTKHERHVGIDTKNMRTMNMNMLLTYYPTMSCVSLYRDNDYYREQTEYRGRF